MTLIDLKGNVINRMSIGMSVTLKKNDILNNRNKNIYHAFGIWRYETQSMKQIQNSAN